MDDDKIESIPIKSCLSVADVKLWLNHLIEIKENRKRGAKKHLKPEERKKNKKSIARPVDTREPRTECPQEKKTI